jgi:hypothetical protein
MTAVAAIVLVIVLATALRPLLPWLFVLFVFGCILKLAIRD